jgi:hypothetical protein
MPVHIEERSGEVRRLIADISGAKAIGWQIEYGGELLGGTTIKAARTDTPKRGKWYYEIENVGWKCNTTDIQAALVIPQIKKLECSFEIRRKYANSDNSAI